MRFGLAPGIVAALRRPYVNKIEQSETRRYLGSMIIKALLANQKDRPAVTRLVCPHHTSSSGACSTQVMPVVQGCRQNTESEAGEAVRHVPPAAPSSFESISSLFLFMKCKRFCSKLSTHVGTSVPHAISIALTRRRHRLPCWG